MYENGTMRPVVTILRGGEAKEKDGECESNQDIL
jgi:hypothetical protein